MADQDISALIRNATRSIGKSVARQADGPTVMEEQAERTRRRKGGNEPVGTVVEGADDGSPCWSLQGQPLREGMTLEVYTDRTNGFLRGQVRLAPWPARPMLVLTLRDAWAPRGPDGNKPVVGEWVVEILDGARCKFPAGG